MSFNPPITNLHSAYDDVSALMRSSPTRLRTVSGSRNTWRLRLPPRNALPN
jgi:hypothetical protein